MANAIMEHNDDLYFAWIVYDYKIDACCMVGKPGEYVNGKQLPPADKLDS